MVGLTLTEITMERKEILLTDMYEAFEPKEFISDNGQTNKWATVTYSNNAFSGTLIAAPQGCAVGNLRLDPKLTGWYKIFITVPCFMQTINYMKLASEERFIYYTGKSDDYLGMEEYLWKCADMTDDAIEISKETSSRNQNSVIVAVRFVPMTDEEVEAYKAEISRQDTKRVYYCDDMKNRPLWLKLNKPEDWLVAVDIHKNTDVEWISPELYEPDPSKGYSYYDVLSLMAARAHELGIKIAPSLKICLWGPAFPANASSSDEKFYNTYRELTCYDRNGDKISSLSFAYPEVRRYRIDQLVKSAACGVDAVNVIGCRGVPFVLFEKPVCDAFYEKYGEYPYELPLTDQRLRALHCSYMTEFFRELREALDERFGKNNIQIHFSAMNSIEDNAYVGFDVEALASKGLVDLIITNPRRYEEIISPEILKDNGRIDIKKYTNYVLKNESSRLARTESEIYNVAEDSPCPRSLQENIAQWNEFGARHNIKIYNDVCHVSAWYNSVDDIHKGISRLYEYGANGIAVWNGADYSFSRVVWDLISKAGHKDEFANISPYEKGYNRYRIIRYQGYSVDRYLPIWGG